MPAGKTLKKKKKKELEKNKNNFLITKWGRIMFEQLETDVACLLLWESQEPFQLGQKYKV